MKIIKKHKILITAIIFIVIISSYYLTSLNKVDAVDNVVLEQEETLKKYIKVDIKGAVNNPGVYEVEEMSRVIDLINMSGGLTNLSDTTTLNLSKVLEDEDVIIIYTKEEVSSAKKENIIIKYVQTECNCPKIENNDACLEENITNDLISINTASKEELMTLPGIGESKALAIIEYRNVTKFNVIEDLKNITGIGDSIFEKIKDLIQI